MEEVAAEGGDSSRTLCLLIGLCAVTAFGCTTAASHAAPPPAPAAAAVAPAGMAASARSAFYVSARGILSSVTPRPARGGSVRHAHMHSHSQSVLQSTPPNCYSAIRMILLTTCMHAVPTCLPTCLPAIYLRSTCCCCCCCCCHTHRHGLPVLSSPPGRPRYSEESEGGAGVALLGL